MIAVVQGVSSASVTVDEVVVGQIGKGLLILVGAAKNDDDKDITYMAEKIPSLRIFSDPDGKMNLSLREIGGALLVVSQFTLLGNTDRGRRPGFEEAATPDRALVLYTELVYALQSQALPVETGRFAALMLVSLQNDGPVTLILDSQKKTKMKYH